MDLLPKEIVYHKIMPYAPCHGLTRLALRNGRLRNRTMSIARRHVRMSTDDWKSMSDAASVYPFTRNNHFEYISANIFLTIFYRNTHFDDYIIIYG